MKKYWIALLSVLLVSIQLSAQEFEVVEESDELLKDIVFDSLDIENNDDFSTFHAFDSLVKDKRIFFTGENHRFRYSNGQLQLKMLQYLHQEVGVRYLMLEFGSSRGRLVDEYINSEDTSLYDVLYLYSFKEYADFYKGIREYNLTLPDSNRLHVIGMDLERFTSLPAKVLSRLIPEDKPIPEEISLSIESLIALVRQTDEWYKDNKKKNDEDKELDFYRSYSSYSSRRTLNTIIEDFDENDSIYRIYLGVHYKLFAETLQELRDYTEYSDYSSQPQKEIYREQYMYKKFKRFMNENKDAKIYGQFGRCHTAKESKDKSCPYRYFDAFAKRLNKDSVLAGSVATFGIYYPKGYDFTRITNSNDYIEDLVELAVENGVSYTKVTQDTAIFGDMTDYFDYIFINNISFEDEEKNLDNTDDPYGYNGSDDNFFVSLTAGYYMTNQTISPLNTSLKDLGFSQYKTPLNEIMFGYTIGQSGDFITKLEASYIPKVDIYNTMDTSMATFGGSNWLVKYGWNVFDVKWLHVEPFIGLGYSQHKLTIQDQAAKISPITNTFGDRIVQEYKNPAFILDASLDLYFRVKFIGIGGTIGYRYDVSKPQWKGANGDLLDNSPDFKNSLMYYGVTFSLIFP